MSQESEERAALLARLRTEGGELIARSAHLASTQELRDLLAAGDAQVAWYRSMGFVDEAESARE